MNHLAFILHKNGTIMPEIDGRPLSDVVREIELPFAEKEGKISLAGAYGGVPMGFLADQVRPSSSNPDDYDCAYLMGCTCGEPGCWPFTAKVSIEGEEVVWSSYEQPHREEWSYSALPPIRFKRSQYEAALAQLPPDLASAIAKLISRSP